MLNKKNNKRSNNSSNNKLPKFNFYWIYGIVAVVLIGINLMNFNGVYTKKIEENQNKNLLGTRELLSVKIKSFINKLKK